MSFQNKIILNYEDVLNTYKSRKHGEKALSYYSHWFPFKASSNLAGIVADLIADGHLQGNPKNRFDYTSNSVSELERFNHEIYLLFGIKGKIRQCTTNKYGTMNLGINNSPLSRSLRLIGVPVGPKVLQPFSIPEWILADKFLFSKFINRLFSCEACVDVQSKAIDIKMYKEISLVNDMISFFKTIQKYLRKYYKISSTNPFLVNPLNIRKDGKQTRGVRIKIKNKDSLIKFKEHIGFDDKNKQKKLMTIT